MSPRVLSLLLVTASSAGCLGDATIPRAQPPGTPVTVEMGHPGYVSPGEEVRFTLRAFNSTDLPVRISDWCGTPLDVEIYASNGRIAQLAGAQAPCVTTPAQFIQPRGTAEVELVWTAPEAPGFYWAYGGGRGQYGLLYSTRASRIQVR